MKLVVGLGNPGPQYQGTRHNLGFDVVDTLAKRWRIDLGSEKFHAWFGLGALGSQRIALMKPTTFMNRSGWAVQAAGQFYKLTYADLIVVVDDMDLPLGRLRLRAGGSSGGHLGLQDIADRLGSEQWARLRIGIGVREGSATGHVLGKFSAEEEAVIGPVVLRAADAVECWIQEGIVAAMNRFNAPSASQTNGEQMHENPKDGS